MKTSSVYFPDLDGLRFLASLLVFLSHTFGGLHSSASPPTFTDRALGLVLHGGGYGVAFFFVLSGFLITYLILRETESRGRLDIRAFYIRRALRIWPLYFAVVAFVLVAYPRLKAAVGFPPSLDIGEAWRYWTFLSNFDVIALGPQRGAMMTNITWSVAIEEQFYVISPLLFWLLRPRWFRWIPTDAPIMRSEGRMVKWA